MQVLNIHRRKINGSINQVAPLLDTLSSGERDQIWPFENWPAMKFKDGLEIGARGGHGPIRYTIEEYQKSQHVVFRFSNPPGLFGVHKFDLNTIDDETTEIVHTIDMYTKGKGTFLWILAIRWLHDALLEDSLDKVEHQFSTKKVKSSHSFYVRFLRWLVGL